MLGCNTVRFQWAIGATLCAAIAAGTLACASATAPPSPDASAAGEVVDVLVESSEGMSRVTLVGPDAPVFTAFQQSAPDRVVIDLANVQAGAFTEAVSVYDGLVEEVRVEPLMEGDAEAMTRVEIWLAAPVDYEVMPSAEGLVIELAAVDGTMEGESGWGEAAEEDPWTAPADDAEMALADGQDENGSWMSGMDDLGEMGDLGGDPAPAPAAPATVLSAVDARAVGEGSMIYLRADGSVESAVSFTLEDPARLVIDLPEMKSEVAADRVEVASAQVARVRVGAHADKVRVVVDGGSAAAPFDGRRVIPVATGLLIALGEDPALDEEMAEVSGMAGPAWAASDEVDTEMDRPSTARGDAWADAEAAPGMDAPADETGGPVRIYGVEFDAQPERVRVVVVGEQAVDYLVYEPDPGTVVLSISNAEIAPEAAVRIAPETAGPVSLVTAFEQPDVKIPEVRVVVRRAEHLKPVVTREGALLMMDFPDTGELAAAPPVYEDGAAGAMQETMGMDPMPLDDAATPAALAPDSGLPLPEPPADPAAGGAPPASIEILNEGSLMDGKEYVGRRISLDFKEVDIADVLRLIAEVSDLNVIAGDEVSGTVTIRLVDVPWDQALDVILLTKGLGFARIGNVLRIAASDVLSQEEELRLQERRAKEKLEDLVVKLQPVNYAAVADVSKIVKQLLTERGTVNVDQRTNTLIIKDIASVIDEATALVKAVDTMTPQVMIEAKIVEAGLQFSRELGSIWTFGTNPLTEATLGGRDYVFQPGDEVNADFGNQVAFGNPITANPSGLLGLAASVLDQKFNLELELQAAEINGDGKVISSPRVVTLDNSPAVIEQGVSIPFQTFENGDAQIEFVDAVLKLDVTPHVTADGSIIMEIEVSRNAPDDSVVTITGSPAIAKNQVETETLVKDGQTLVLGGIYVVDRSERSTHVPYLSRLPFLGPLFRSSEFSDDRKELLIFVSPRVVETPGVEAS